MIEKLLENVAQKNDWIFHNRYLGASGRYLSLGKSFPSKTGKDVYLEIDVDILSVISVYQNESKKDFMSLDELNNAEDISHSELFIDTDKDLNFIEHEALSIHFEQAQIDEIKKVFREVLVVLIDNNY